MFPRREISLLSSGLAAGGRGKHSGGRRESRFLSPSAGALSHLQTCPASARQQARSPRSSPGAGRPGGFASHPPAGRSRCCLTGCSEPYTRDLPASRLTPASCHQLKLLPGCPSPHQGLRQCRRPPSPAGLSP